jgi:hypothetical protein
MSGRDIPPDWAPLLEEFRACVEAGARWAARRDWRNCARPDA